jgi:hypothetical protein
MRSLIVACLVVTAGMVVPDRTAHAKIPSAALSTITRPMVACPAGDVSFTTVMHNVLDLPCSYVWTVVEFNGCTSVQLPPARGDEGYDVVLPPVNPWPALLAQGDVEGAKTFALRAGGVCPASTVRIYGDGVLVAQRALASPDQDGNFGVGVDDLVLAQAKLGTADPTADFDGDGTVTVADLDILRAHFGHHAPGMVTPAASRSWGTLKLTYR